MRMHKTCKRLPRPAKVRLGVAGRPGTRPVRYNLADFEMLLPAPTRTVSLEDMDRAIADHVAENR